MDNIAFWDRFARKYDTFMKYFSPEYPALIQRISRDAEGAQRILEVATGTGLIALELGRPGRQVDAIDISPVMIAQAQKKGQARGLDSIWFVVGSAYALPWPSECYDVAICANALHVMEHPSRALGEIKRVLKDRGKLILPTYCHGEYWRARIMSRLMHLSGFKVYTYFTAGGLQAFLEKHGFSTIVADKSGGAIPLCHIVAWKVPSVKGPSCESTLCR